MQITIVRQHVIIVPESALNPEAGTVMMSPEVMQWMQKFPASVAASSSRVVAVCEYGQEELMLGSFMLDASDLLRQDRLEVWMDMAGIDQLSPRVWRNRAGQLPSDSFIFITVEHARALGFPPAQCVPGKQSFDLKVPSKARETGRQKRTKLRDAAAVSRPAMAETVKDGTKLQEERSQALNTPEMQEAVRRVLEGPEEREGNGLLFFAAMAVVALVAILAYLQQ